MVRFLTAAACAAITLATPALAAGVRAVPVAAQSGKIVAGETLWTCGAAGCAAAAITSRPAVACAQVVKQIGAVESFAVGDKALDADELAKCNARAKGGTALARN